MTAYLSRYCHLVERPYRAALQLIGQVHTGDTVFTSAGTQLVTFTPASVPP